MNEQISGQIEFNVKKDDRILVLKVKEGQKPKDSTGLVDPRLFTGENKLHAIIEPQSGLWYFKQEFGGLPQPLKQKFTKFSSALEHARRYYESRNIDIVEVID